MKNNFWGEIVITVMLIGVLLFYIKPVYFFMPEIMHPLMLPLLILLFLVFAGFLWKETPGDERQELHKYISTRFAYFSGITVIFVGVYLETLHENLDIWLVIALCIMLFSKFLGLVYAYIKH